jgi:predicted metal-dependent hydrolase
MAQMGPLEDGGTFRYRGETHHLRVVAGPGRRRTTVTREGGEAGDELVVRIGPSERRGLDAILEAWLREKARAAIHREIERHAAALAVAPAAVTIRDARTRWGSCSRAKRLSFSWRLVLAPPEALETVVIHELAHLRVFGHGPSFWAIVAGRRPDHKLWRRWLRDHAMELHGALAEGQ